MAEISKYVKKKERVSEKYLIPRAQEIHDKALELASSGKIYKEIAKELKISPNTLRNICLDDAKFKSEIEQAMESASIMVLEDIKQVPYKEMDAARARVKIEALRTYLELRWPGLYGKRIDVTIRTLDMRQALDMARQRVKDRAQPIDLKQDSNGVFTDKESVDTTTINSLALASLLE